MTTDLAAPVSAEYEEYWTRLQDSARYHPANRFRYALIARRILKYVDRGKTVLDMGCGDARLLRHLRAMRPHNVFAGCDISSHVVGLNAANNPGIAFFAADVAAADFAARAASAGAGAVDAIVSSEVIEHVEDDRGLVANLATLLKPGGYAILTTQSGPRYRIDLELLHHLRHYDRRALDGMLRDAGLEIVESFNCGFPVLNLQKIVANAMFDTVIKATATSTRPPLPVRVIMNVMYAAMRLSPHGLGPQLVVVARKPA